MNDGILRQLKQLCKFVPHIACDSWCIFIVSVTILCLSAATYGVLHLDNGTSLQSGTLMFQLNNGTWGTVCSNGFDQNAANVTCKQLRYNYGDYATW